MKLVLLLCVFISTFSWSQVFVNEASNANGTTLVQSDGSNPDWIELFNSGTTNIDLGGYGLTDDPTNPLKWQFPNYNLSANGFLTVLASGQSDTNVVSHYETAVFANDTWQYTVPSANLPANWNTLSFSTVSWTSAPLSIGYGDGDDVTTLTGPITSIYAKKIFTVADVSAIKAAIFDIDYDDGFVAYLNGVEIARSGVSGNPPAWDEFSADHEATLYQGGTITSYVLDYTTIQSLLTNGLNVLAIEVHNSSVSSSDMSLIPYLTFGFNQPTIYYSGTTHPFFQSAANSFFFNTNFSIGTNGETVYLSDPTGLILDSLVVPHLEPDMSVGKLNDGTATNFMFNTPTPSQSNNLSAGYTGFENAPIIDTAGGFRTSSVSVTITNTSLTGGVVRYTTNGQDPTVSSLLYSGPIVLSTNSVLKAKCFPVLTTSLPSSTATETFFFMEDFTIPVISITTDPTNLYGATGIFDNYTTDWRKPCVIEYFDADGIKQFESRASIKPDGGAGGSRSNPQHSVTIEPAHNLYGEGEPVHYPLIPEKGFIHDFYAFYLRNGSNMWNQYPQKDATFMRIMRETNANSQAYSPVVAFVNGQYFGVYELREKANEGYFENNYGNDRDSLDLLSISYFYGAGVLRTVKGSDTGFYNMRNFITTYDPTSPDYFQKSHEKLDLYNFTDYLAGENFFANADWIYNNMKVARTRTAGNRWRFFLQDMELGLGVWTDYNYNTFDYFRYNNQPNPFWDIYNGLTQNDEFKNYFINRYADLMNTTFRPAYFTPIVDAMYNQLLPEMPRHFQTWTGDIPGGMATYANIHNDIINQITNRSNVIRTQMLAEYSLTETVDVTLNVQPAGAGYIKISTIVPSALPWTGVYFDGNPVKITAVANPGYTFSSWQANSVIPAVDLDTNSIFLNIGNDDTFLALYTGAAEPTGLTVSEIHYNPDPSVDGGNWIELHNNGTTAAELTGWKVKSKHFWDKYTFEDGTTIPANGYLVVCQDTNLFKAQYPTITNFVGATGYAWSNKLDSIKIYNAQNQLVVMAEYRDSAPFPECADGWGRSLENSAYQTNQLDSTVWFCGCIGGSPGKAYEPCIEALQISEINYNNNILAVDAGDWIELHNASSSALNVANYTFQDAKNQHVFTLPSVTLEAGQYLVLSNDLVLFGGEHSNVTNVSGTFDFGLAEKDALRLYNDAGVLVTSVLYDNVNAWPTTPSTDNYTLEYDGANGYVNPNVASSWFVGCEGGSPGRGFTPCAILPDGEDVFLYPNPTEGLINVVFDNSTNSSGSTDIEIFDVQGNIVKSMNFVTDESTVMIQMNLDDLRHGVYYLRVKQTGMTVQKPFVKI